ncbi:MAG TPA: biopolymer transporter ExbD [Spirochaetota bacterium]|nr:biopolymer transporter ExbD [Spirochaetota bacterium]
MNILKKKALIRKISIRSKKKRFSRDEKSFESSAMGDLAFLLLIFFIVTSSFMIRQGIFFSLPSNTAGVVRLTDDQIMEVAPQNNGFLYRGMMVERAAFLKMMEQQMKADAKKVLIIAMGSTVKYDRLVDTLSVAKEAGIRRVSLKQMNGE